MRIVLIVESFDFRSQCILLGFIPSFFRFVNMSLGQVQKIMKGILIGQLWKLLNYEIL
jgi:hypothetical protein